MKKLIFIIALIFSVNTITAQLSSWEKETDTTVVACYQRDYCVRFYHCPEDYDKIIEYLCLEDELLSRGKLVESKFRKLVRYQKYFNKTEAFKYKTD